MMMRTQHQKVCRTVILAGLNGIIFIIKAADVEP
jgi:hypothetical protein